MTVKTNREVIESAVRSMLVQAEVDGTSGVRAVRSAFWAVVQAVEGYDLLVFDDMTREVIGDMVGQGIRAVERASETDPDA